MMRLFLFQARVALYSLSLIHFTLRRTVLIWNRHFLCRLSVPPQITNQEQQLRHKSPHCQTLQL